MKKDWFSYYKNHKKIHLSNILLHWSYLFKILSLGKKNILEIGCGPADHSIFLSYIKPGIKISLLDYDKKIIKNLRKKYYGKIKKFYVCDIVDEKNVKRQRFKPNEFSLIYSQGLMEHFNKKDFQTIIYNFLPFSKKIIFSVPSENYPNLDFGNEILRNKKELEEILNKIRGIKYKVSKYFPDIGLRTKIIKIKKNKLNLIKSINMILFGSLHYSVEIEKK